MVSRESQNHGLTQGGKDPQATAYSHPLLQAGLISPLDVAAQGLVEVVQLSMCIQASGKEKLCWRLANSIQTKIWEPQDAFQPRRDWLPNPSSTAEHQCSSK